MKKSLLAVLSAALVTGVSATTFAAANPFSDVPEDHWAYDAVAQLAADGVIEGYGDTTFRGDRNITRYEMAQMVAKAMTRSGLSAEDKALLDRLASEFADELRGLGVRVARLERNADKVKWTGKLEYTYTSERFKGDGESRKVNDDELLFRLEPTAELNDHWQVKSRLDAYLDMARDNADTDAENLHGHEQDSNVSLRRVYAEGEYGNFNFKLGKLGLTTSDGRGQAGALLFDDDQADYSGISVTYGTKLKATVMAGRMDISDSVIAGYAALAAGAGAGAGGITADLVQQIIAATNAEYAAMGITFNTLDDIYAHYLANAGGDAATAANWTAEHYRGILMGLGGYTADEAAAMAAELAVPNYVIPADAGGDADFNDTANFQGLNLDYNVGKFTGGLGYYHFSSSSFENLNKDVMGSRYNYGNNKEDNANIWSLSAGWDFDGASRIFASLAKNTNADNFDQSWQVEYDYKGANPEDKGSWGAYLAYRKLAPYTSFFPTDDGLVSGSKGWEIGADYTVIKNMVIRLKYGQGESLFNDKIDTKKLFARLDFFF